jgi:cell filamentation protein
MSLGSRYDSFDDPYCYSGTFILKNRLDLRDYDALEAFEHESVSAKGEVQLPSGSFDPAHYCAIHRHLFCEVYDWAGEYRTVRTAKGGDMFCYPEYIAAQMDALFASLRGASFARGSDPKAFVTAAATFLADLNAIHPFREGNGRTQLTFLFLLGHRAGHALDMTRIRAEEMLAAMIASFKGKLEPLEIEIARLLT